MQTKRKGKWQAFEALSSFKGTLGKALEDHQKIQRPILTQDRLEELDLQLQAALASGKEVNIRYYQNGRIEELLSKVLKVDVYQKQIHLEHGKVLLENIIDIT